MKTNKQDYLNELEVENNISHIEILKKNFISERFSPDILPYQKNSVEFLLNGIEKQQETLNNEQDPKIVNLKLIEIERLKYLISSYLRTRLQKVKKIF
jgi:GINS complex subunit 4